MKVGTVSKVMLGGNADVSAKSGIIIDADVILGKAEGRTKDLKGLVLSNKVMFGKSVSRAKMATVSGVAPLVLADAISANVVELIAFGGTEQRNLPPEYTQLDYIESSGTQYINTGVAVKANTRVRAEFEFTSSTPSTRRLFGKIAGASSGAMNYREYSSFYWFQSNTITTSSAGKHLIEFQTDGNVYLDGDVIGTKGTFSSGSDLPIYLFAELSDSSNINYGSVKVYRFTIFEGTTIVKDLFPCKRVSDNVLGMYDTVSGSFLTNEGTGTFTAGNVSPTPDSPLPVVSNNGVLKFVDDELPAGYRRLQDVIYNNDCYYTITGLRPTGADTLKFSFECTQSQPACNVVGCYTTSSAQDNLSLYVGYTQSTAKYLRYNGGTYSSWVIADKRYDVQITPTGSIGMETEETWEQKTFTCSVDFNIGTTSTGATSSKLVGVLYGNIEVVGRAKLIPCKRVSDGYIGYYDTYTETFYEKAWGSEPTTSGYDYSHCVLVADGTVETINIHGKNLSPNELDNVGYTSTGGTSTSATFCGNLHKIKCENGEKYTVSCGNFPDGISGVFVNTWKTDGTFNSRQAIAMSTSYTYTIPAGIGQVNFTLYKTGGITIGSNSWLQVEKGNTATDYEPYFNGGTATTEMLLKVGDYQDQQEIISGAVTRKVGIKVLDGTEEWRSSVTSKFYLDNDYMRNYNSMPVFCTHYKAVLASGTSGVGYGEIGLFATGTPGVSSARLVIGDNNHTSVDNFKAFLANQYAAGTPVIVVYPLKTETTETVTGQPMTTTQGTNFAEITQASLDGLELSVTYMAGVDATVEEIENAQLSPDVDVTIE